MSEKEQARLLGMSADREVRLRARIAELEKALRFYAEAQDFYLWDKSGAYVDSANDLARTVLGL